MGELEFGIMKLIGENENKQIPLKDIEINLSLYTSSEIEVALKNLNKNGRIKIWENEVRFVENYYGKFAEKLYIHQNGILIGYLGFDFQNGYEFAYDTDYLISDNKPVKFSMPLAFKNYKGNNILTDFEEYIPEGIDKKILIEKSGTPMEFYLLKNNDYNANDLIFSETFSYDKIKQNNKINSIDYFLKNKKQILGENDFPNILNLDIRIDEKNLFVNHTSISNRQNAKEVRNMSISGYQHKTNVIIENGIMRLPNNFIKENVYYFIKPYDKKRAEFNDDIYTPHLAINEHLHMSFAKNELGFDVPYTAIFKREQDKEFHFLVKYFDRDENFKIQRKEFASIMGVPTENKYRISSEELFQQANLVLNQDDKLRMLEYYFYSFVIKYNDMHTKNISVLANEEKNILAPLYDICSTGIYNGFYNESALDINNKKYNIKFDDFINLVKIANIDETLFKEKAVFILKTYIEKMPQYIEKLKEFNLEVEEKYKEPNLKPKQFYEIMKNHYEKRLNELNKNGWFEALNLEFNIKEFDDDKDANESGKKIPKHKK